MPDDYQNQGNTSLPDDAGMAELLRGLGIGDDNNDSSQQTPPATPDNNGANDTGASADDGTQAQSNGQAQGDNAQSQAQADDANAANAQQKQQKAFAEMRANIGAYEKFIGHLMKATGFTGSREDFIKDMTERAYAQQAKTQGQGMDPNILKRLDELENKNKVLEEQNNRTLFASNLKNLQTHFNLTDKELTDFVNLAVKEHIDLTIPGTNFIALYQGLNHDALVNKAIENARQEWLGSQAKGQQTATVPDGKSGKKDPSPTDVNTMAEFNSLLNNLPK